MLTVNINKSQMIVSVITIRTGYSITPLHYKRGLEYADCILWCPGYDI